MVQMTSLTMRPHHSNAYRSGEGVKQYRALQGAAASSATEVGKRPGTVEVSLDLPHDRPLVEQMIETAYSDGSRPGFPTQTSR